MSWMVRKVSAMASSPPRVAMGESGVKDFKIVRPRVQFFGYHRPVALTFRSKLVRDQRFSPKIAGSRTRLEQKLAALGIMGSPLCYVLRCPVYV